MNLSQTAALKRTPLHFKVISLFPEMILSGLKEGVVASAIDHQILSVSCLNPRKFSKDVHQSVDDRPFGGGDGMIMVPDPVEQAITELQKSDGEAAPIICLSARGEVYNNEIAVELSQQKALILICGRYGGIDQRLLAKHSVREISIGDYILSGGELAALVLIDSIARHLPGVLGNQESATKDSFADGLLEAPSFTRPRDWGDLEVPATLLAGDHKKIDEWRMNLSILSSIQMREDLFLKKKLNLKQLQQAKIFFEKMSESERFVCGLKDYEKILSALENAITRSQSSLK